MRNARKHQAIFFAVLGFGVMMALHVILLFFPHIARMKLSEAHIRSIWHYSPLLSRMTVRTWLCVHLCAHCRWCVLTWHVCFPRTRGCVCAGFLCAAGGGGGRWHRGGGGGGGGASAALR
jgi:hypothetical protein